MIPLILQFVIEFEFYSNIDDSARYLCARRCNSYHIHETWQSLAFGHR